MEAHQRVSNHCKFQKRISLYVMHVMVFSREVNVANKNVSIELWHKKRGYMSQKGLDVIARKSILPETTCMHLETCIDFLVGKQHRVSFH